MKTTVFMRRSLLGGEIRQDSITGMFNVTDLHAIANRQRELEGQKPKQMASYFLIDSTNDLIDALCVEEKITTDKLKKTSRGKFGGTWVHPVIFLDMAMWYSPVLRIKVIKWVLDGLLSVRNDSGESFKSMSSELTKCFPREFRKPIAYARIANQISDACEVGTGRDRWQSASAEQLALRDRIQNNVIILADSTENSGTCVIKAIRKAVRSSRRSKQST